MIRTTLMITAAAMLTGCGITTRLVTVNVPVAIACQVQEPARPMMDTETLEPEAPVDVQARAMRAEIERREGYEGELRAALRACRRITAEQ